MFTCCAWSLKHPIISGTASVRERQRNVCKAIRLEGCSKHLVATAATVAVGGHAGWLVLERAVMPPLLAL